MKHAKIYYNDKTEGTIKNVVYHEILEGGLVKITTKCGGVGYVSAMNIYSLTILEEGDDT